MFPFSSLRNIISRDYRQMTSHLIHPPSHSFTESLKQLCCNCNTFASSNTRSPGNFFPSSSSCFASEPKSPNTYSSYSYCFVGKYLHVLKRRASTQCQRKANTRNARPTMTTFSSCRRVMCCEGHALSRGRHA